MKPDILIFMSDQHSPYFSGWLNASVDTPNLDRLCREGTRFDEAYTACPLCVPARVAMMSGQYPYRTGVFTNSDAFPNTQPSILHPLVEAGYETVLCGRMHFVGLDQRHGFTRRIAPDTTPVGWTRPVEKLRHERGAFVPTYTAKGATNFVGGGESPVVNYDRMVVQAALDYLAQDHKRPQCMVVGTYGPHFPYVAPRELYKKYLDRVRLPETFYDVPPYLNELLRAKQHPEISEEKAKGALAAYCGLVELMDEQIGQVHRAFQSFTARRGTQGVFCYLSDHGDQVGDRAIYGKDTFFEKSAKIPLIFAGEGIKAGLVSKTPASILDIGPTLWELAGSECLPVYDGINLVPTLGGKQTDPMRTVVCEHLHKGPDGRYVHGLMLRQGDEKYIRYRGYNEMLFDVRLDPLEREDLAAQRPGRMDELRRMAKLFCPPEQEEMIQQEQLLHDQRLRWFRSWEAAAGLDESERWQDNPPAAREKPEICIE